MPYTVVQRTIRELINDAKIRIPEHQRPYIWKDRQSEGFVVTIMDELPTQSLIMYQTVEDGKLVLWLEDGQQRFTCVRKFHSGEFEDNVKWDGRTYADFTIEEKTRFENYRFSVTIMEDVSYERRLALFQAIQEGTPLTNGQRFHALSSHSPLIQFAKTILNNSRCKAIWGDYARVSDVKYQNLSNAVAIAAGIAFKNIDMITTSYEILGKNGALTRTFDPDEANDTLNKLIRVYERADVICPTTIRNKKKEWSVGKFTGYILYSLCIPDRVWEDDKEMFAQYIAKTRRDSKALKIISYKKPATRNWNSARWKQGLENLDNQDEVELAIGNNAVVVSEEEDDDDQVDE